MKTSTLISISLALNCINALPSFKNWNILNNQQVLINDEETNSLKINQEVPPSYENSESFIIENYIDETKYLKLPEINSTELQNLITKENLKNRANDLYKVAETSIKKYNHPTRVIGSPGHWATVRYIISELSKLGGYYNIKTQSFNATDGHVESFSLLINGIKPKSLLALALTPPTPNKSPVNGNLILVNSNGCKIEDYPSQAKDNIVLIKRGECSFGDKSRIAGKFGALGAIIYDSNGAIQGTLGTPTGDEVPTLSVDEKDVKEYIDKLIQDPNYKFETTLYIDSYVKNITTLNVIADTVFGDHDNIVGLGAHSDSVAAGPGINDDGSGTLSLLEVAKQLTKFKINNAVRFGFYSGEEAGLLGSLYYSDHLSSIENSKLRLFMDYDMMASPNFEYEIYDANNKDHPNGSGDLKDLYVNWYKDHGLNYTFVPFDGRSDYVGFINHGIPAGGIATGAEGVKNAKSKEKFGGEINKWFDPCYHQLCDDLNNVNYTAWELNTQLIGHSVATYAKSFDGFPKRKLDDKVMINSIDDENKEMFIRRGHNYII
ncbi:APE3 [Candida pseudojiufengensis]|uniref:APE3 n=1 Tax=Candida pseudojiufengensis TaxID=497109 RepID=UPI002224D9B4|nr:APE3 [Candida pseudojiufengensis]KAI5965173.1 APE3 [Candida pseudojiufengensis]